MLEYIFLINGKNGRFIRGDMTVTEVAIFGNKSGIFALNSEHIILSIKTIVVVGLYVSFKSVCSFSLTFNSLFDKTFVTK